MLFLLFFLKINKKRKYNFFFLKKKKKSKSNIYRNLENCYNIVINIILFYFINLCYIL